MSLPFLMYLVRLLMNSVTSRGHVFETCGYQGESLNFTALTIDFLVRKTKAKGKGTCHRLEFFLIKSVCTSKVQETHVPVFGSFRFCFFLSASEGDQLKFTAGENKPSSQVTFLSGCASFQHLFSGRSIWIHF